MKRYKLIKDLPTFQAGDEFVIGEDGCLWLAGNNDGQYCGMSMTGHWKKNVMAYHKNTLKHFPNILEDWFEEIENVGERIPNRGDTYWYVDYDGDIFHEMWLDVHKDNDKASIGNVFRNEEEAEKAVEKLKAWKRLKDKGLKTVRNTVIDPNSPGESGVKDITVHMSIPLSVGELTMYSKDLNLLFGGEDE